MQTVADTYEALTAQLCELTKRWNTWQDIPRSQQLECKKIGERLNAVGGKAMMTDAYYEAKSFNAAASVVRAYWNGVGDWLW